MEAEDGKLDFEESSDDTEVGVASAPGKVLMSMVRLGRISEMCRKGRVLSGRTGLIWSL